MKDPNRIPRMLKLLEQRWREKPDLRLGQLLDSIVFLHLSAANAGTYFIEDSDLEQALAGGWVHGERAPAEDPGLGFVQGKCSHCGQVGILRVSPDFGREHNPLRGAVCRDGCPETP